MLGHFPTPYPDELFYSICARFSDRMRYPVVDYAVRELFGALTNATIELPGYLDYFISILPPGHRYTADDIIDHHTLLPFYQPFLLEQRRQLVRAKMRQGGRRRTVYNISACNRPKLMYLRYCPVCAKQDREKYGECYWHRAHQLSGIDVCPDHLVFLEDSDVLRKDRVSQLSFFSTEGSIHKVCPRPMDLSNDCHKVRLHIARDAVWLLDQQNLVCGPKSMRKRYLYLLAKQGFASYHGTRAHTSKLVTAFKDRYPSELLAQLDSALEDEKKSWIARIIQSISTLQPPVQHLLLMHFLGHTARKFFNLSVEEEQFGAAPWPCLSPVSPHNGQPVIRECKTVANGKGERPRGIFSCECGFIYSRVGPNLTETDRFRYDRIESFGPVWEAELKRLWNDPTITLKSIETRLKVSRQTIFKQADRLGLKYPRPKPDLSAKRDEARQTWLAEIEKSPAAGISELRKINRLYYWLWWHDGEWLDQHTPRVSSTSPSVDWASRDVELADEVKNSANQLRNIKGRPVQITMRGIIKDITCSTTWLAHYLYKLPLTSKALEKVVETQEDVNLRRVNWALDYFTKEGKHPDRTRFLQYAGLHIIVGMPRVDAAIEQALRALRPKRSKESVENTLKRREKRRKAWLQVIDENPGTGRTVLKKENYKLSQWLNKYDSEWFKAHQPPSHVQRARVGWQARDREFAELVGPTAEQLRHHPGRPVRITIAKIAGELGRNLIMPHLDKLPMTAEALERVVETHEMLAARRIQWAVGYYREAGVRPTRNQLTVRAAIRQYAKLPGVKEAIDAALDALSLNQSTQKAAQHFPFLLYILISCYEWFIIKKKRDSDEYRTRRRV